LALPPPTLLLDPNDDYVTGGGSPYSGFGSPSVGVDARSGPTGSNASGTFSYEFWWVHKQEKLRDATVTCLKVEGNRALVGGYGTVEGWSDYNYDPADPSKSFYSYPTAFELYVEDNVTSLRDWETPGWIGDQVGFRFYAGTPSCASIPASYETWPIMAFNAQGQADVVVHDAPSLPQTAAACKNGGYSAYRFKNQGECAAFVERGPKPKP
jgi:hypothetical protein